MNFSILIKVGGENTGHGGNTEDIYPLYLSKQINIGDFVL